LTGLLGVPGPRIGTVREPGGKASSLSSLPSGRAALRGFSPSLDRHGRPAAFGSHLCLRSCGWLWTLPGGGVRNILRMRAHEVVACADGNASVLATTLGRAPGHFGAQIGGGCVACCFGAGRARWRHASRVRGVHAARGVAALLRRTHRGRHQKVSDAYPVLREKISLQIKKAFGSRKN